MARGKPYQIQHASGRITTTSSQLWNKHVNTGELVRLTARRALVAAHLICYAENGALHFRDKMDRGFSGEYHIPSGWSAVIRAWLLKGPFAPACDIDYTIRDRACTRIEAYNLLQE